MMAPAEVPALAKAPAAGGLAAWTSMDEGRNAGPVWAGRIVLLSFAAAMFLFTWASWPDLVIDCGREMYVPAAMARGKHLYRDLWYSYGPLAPWLNSLFFRAFGAHLNVLYGVGLALAASSALLTHSIALRFLPPAGALVAGLCFLAPGFQADFFNIVLPYSFAATYGLMLCLAELLFLLRYVEKKQGPNLVLAGICCGLALICKHECLLPCGAGIVIALWFRREGVRTALALLPGAAIACGVYGWLVSRYGLDFLIHGNWMSAPGTYFMQRYGALWVRQAGLRFQPVELAGIALKGGLAILLWVALARLLRAQRWIAALCATVLFLLPGPAINRWIHSLRISVFPFEAKTLALAGAALGTVVCMYFLVRAAQGRGKPSPLALTVAGTLALVALRTRFDATSLVFPRGMFCVVALAFAFLAVRAFVRRRRVSAQAFVAAGMALMLALRVMVEIRVYGYALFSTAILFIVYLAVLWWMVEWTLAKAQPAVRGRGTAFFFAAFLAVFGMMTAGYYKNNPMATMRTPAGDVRRSLDHTILIERFLPAMEEAKRNGETVLLLPELSSLYFLSGMDSPSRYMVLTPGVLEPGKYMDGFLRELEAHPPDTILLSNRRSSEYGVDYFGLDYDQEVLNWVKDRYRLTGEIGKFVRAEGAPIAALVYRRR